MAQHEVGALLVLEARQLVGIFPNATPADHPAGRASGTLSQRKSTRRPGGLRHTQRHAGGMHGTDDRSASGTSRARRTGNVVGMISIGDMVKGNNQQPEIPDRTTGTLYCRLIWRRRHTLSHPRRHRPRPSGDVNFPTCLDAAMLVRNTLRDPLADLQLVVRAISTEP